MANILPLLLEGVFITCFLGLIITVLIISILILPSLLSLVQRIRTMGLRDAL